MAIERGGDRDRRGGGLTGRASIFDASEQNAERNLRSFRTFQPLAAGAPVAIRMKARVSFIQSGPPGRMS